MTTIVVDRKRGLMAADRMVTANDGDATISCSTKIERVPAIGGDYLVGMAGMEGPAEHFLEWFRNGDWDDPPSPWDSLEDDYSFSILILGPDGIFVADKFMRLIPIEHRYYGIGSGGLHAWSVLEAGCDIDTAMSVAIRMDPHSGFGYQVRHRDAKEREFDWEVD